MQKRYWLRGGVAGLILGIFVWILPQIFCSDFYRIGPAYPTDQPICYSLVVNQQWVEIAIVLLILGVLIGWIYGKARNRSVNNY